ncbi:MAG: hypothetical protein JSR76_02080 [Verrucomicrobia bacterium]|nr:hypothetical protein [Verrucomicrobiota bacterium]
MSIRRISLLLLLLTFTLFSTKAYAYDSLLRNTSMQDDYTYDNTDSNQKKIACGMYLWGFLLFCGIVVVSLVVPNDPSTASTSTAGQNSNSTFTSNGANAASLLQ